MLVQRGVTYVVTCGPRPPAGLAESRLSTSLWGQLQAGKRLGWLEPVAELSGSPQTGQALNEPEFAGTSRNADCPCGSGKKYKKCHGAPGGPTGLTTRVNG